MGELEKIRKTLLEETESILLVIAGNYGIPSYAGRSSQLHKTAKNNYYECYVLFL